MTRRGRLRQGVASVLAAAALSACGANESGADGDPPPTPGSSTRGDDSGPSSEGGGRATSADAGSVDRNADGGVASADGQAFDAPPPVQGSIIVHCPVGARALLGDGSKFNAVVPASGAVTFTDPSIAGPQVASCIATNGGNVGVTSYAGFDVDEVGASYPAGSPYALVAHVTGSISLFPSGANGGSVQAFPAGRGFSFQSNGPYGGVDVYAASGQSTFDLIAYAASIQGSSGTWLSAGMRRDIPVPAASDGSVPELTGMDIALDHPFDQNLTVTASGLGTYSGTLALDATWYRGDVAMMSAASSGPGPTQTIGLVALTPPFDVLTPVVGASGSDPSTGTAGTATAIVAPGASAVSVSLPDKLLVTTPATAPAGVSTLPTVAFAPGSSIAWTADPSAQIVRGYLFCGNPQFTWNLVVAARQGSFTFFIPPSVPFFCANTDVNVRLAALSYDGASLAQALAAELTAGGTPTKYATKIAANVAHFHMQ